MNLKLIFPLPILFVLQSICLAQVELEETLLPEQISTSSASSSSASTTTPTPLSPPPPFPTELRICNPTDIISVAHCNCSSDVISCDFRNFNGSFLNSKTSPPKVEVELFGYQYPENASRLCLCNTPRNLHLKLTRGKFLPFPNRIKRFDLYNLMGKTHFNGGFSEHFNGDLVISRVALIPEIQANEFGRGSDVLEHDHLEDLKCCSPVKLDENYKKPVLLMEHTAVASIRTRGINDIHLWSTVIFKLVDMSNVETQGVTIQAHHSLDAAFLGCRFRNTSYQSVEILEASDILLMKNYFKRGCDSVSFESISNTKGSNAVVIDNKFWNAPVLSFEANNFVLHHNLFDNWDNWTFNIMRFSSFGNDRNISIKYNSVNWEDLRNGSISFVGGNLDLRDNVIGTCNCSNFVFEDERLDAKLNWCFTGIVANANEEFSQACSINLGKALGKCKVSPETDFKKSCGGDGSVKGLVVGEMETSAVGSRVDSDFIKLIVQDLGKNLNLEKIKGVVQQDEEHSGANKGTPNVNNNNNNNNDVNGKPSTRSSHGAVITIVSFMLILVLLGVGVFAYRNRERWRRLLLQTRGQYHQHQSLDGGSREVFI